MALRLLKFDTINPQAYIVDKIKEQYDSFSKFKRGEALDWIIATRGNFSDFYTYNLRKLGWESEEFFMNDYYIEKVAEEMFGLRKSYLYAKTRIKNLIRPSANRWKKVVISAYIKKYNPDVILVREISGMQSDFWKPFGMKSLLVSRIASPIPPHWFPGHWDIVLTSTEAYKTFFNLNGVKSYINPNGFDLRILDELSKREKKYDVTFVGGLGDRHWARRTKCIASFADKVNFKWWGYNGNRYKQEQSLKRSWQGITSGIDMLQIYKDSKIVFNDYGEVADGEGVNQRLFEALGVGSMLLTRNAENLRKNFPSDIFVTFDDERDCLEKINYYLKNEEEREKIAKRGQEYLLGNFTYDRLMTDIDIILKEGYESKFGRNLNRNN